MLVSEKVHDPSLYHCMYDGLCICTVESIIKSVKNICKRHRNHYGHTTVSTAGIKYVRCKHDVSITQVLLFI